MFLLKKDALGAGARVGVASGRKTNRINFYLLLSAATTSFVWLPECIAALPPPAQDASGGGAVDTRGQTNGGQANDVAPEISSRMVGFAMEPFRLGGMLTYNLRHDSGDGVRSSQQGITATLNVGSGIRGYIWQPWFSNFAGSVGLTTQNDDVSYASSSNGVTASNKSNSKNTTVIGNARLSLLPYSRFPFELHIDRSDTRTSNNLSADDGYSNQRFGFSQRYSDPKLSASLGWDRNTQFSERNGGSRQDNLQLSMSPVLGGNQNLQLTGTSARNFQERTGERTTQDNIAAQYSYTPNPDISVDNSANISHSGYNLAEGESDARFIQLSSLIFWRPKDSPLTMTGGVRLFSLTNEGSNNNSTNAFVFRSRNANFNIGANYDFSRYTRLSASGNLNLIDSNGEQSNSTNESLALTYNPEQIKLDKYIYNWSASANAANSDGNKETSTRQLLLQMSHGLSRNTELQDGSLYMSVTQAITSQFNSGIDPVYRLVHNGMLSWNLSQAAGTALLSLTASDSRTLGGGEAFQLVNFQASSNLPTGRYSTWTGSLTIQAVRQKIAAIAGSGASGSQNFTTTSSGSISYQNQRAFGIPRLRFISDIRLNSQGLLPILSGPEEQTTSNWDNSLDYAIGRTQLKLNTRLSKSAGKTNKSILFTATRMFGNS